MSMRGVNAVLVVAALAMAFALYKVKYDSLASVREIEGLKVEVAREREAISILKAEWSHLNQPQRLESLARRHLQLESLDASQILRLAEIPEGPAGDPYANRPTIGDLMKDLSLTAPGEQP